MPSNAWRCAVVEVDPIAGRHHSKNAGCGGWVGHVARPQEPAPLSRRVLDRQQGGHAYPGDAMVSLAGQRSKAMAGGFMAATRPALQVPSAPSTWTLLKIGGVSLFRLPETKKNPPTRVFWCWSGQPDAWLVGRLFLDWRQLRCLFSCSDSLGRFDGDGFLVARFVGCTAHCQPFGRQFGGALVANA